MKCCICRREGNFVSGLKMIPDQRTGRVVEICTDCYEKLPEWKVDRQNPKRGPDNENYYRLWHKGIFQGWLTTRQIINFKKDKKIPKIKQPQKV